MSSRRAALAGALACLLASCAGQREPRVQAKSEPEASRYDAGFWSVWGDGQAELAAYDLAMPRYGQVRQGTAVSIFVSETFSKRLRVKADPGKHPADDQFPAMKLNLVEDYQTGVYDYNDMTSVFVSLAEVSGRPAGSPAKVSFSEQEWCGHVYLQGLFDLDVVRIMSHSYFDGEADQQGSLAYPDNGVAEDQLPLWARGMAQPFLRPGESRTVPYLPSMRASRHAHVPLQWGEATLTRGTGTQAHSVPGGEFSVEAWTAKDAKGATRTYLVEAALPHRIVQWESSTGERGTLVGLKRMKYWEMNGEGKEAALKELGLARRGARMP